MKHLFLGMLLAAAVTSVVAKDVSDIGAVGVMQGVCAAKHDDNAATITIKVNRVAKNGDSAANIGEVTFTDTNCGLLINPALHGLTPGMHGFHVHQKPDCSNLGMNAGGHFDPYHTDKHLGPYDTNGHLGDLPVLYVDAKGKAISPTLAPRLTVSELYGHSLMVHEGGDNYSDTPAKLGGGGKRVACGVFPKENEQDETDQEAHQDVDVS